MLERYSHVRMEAKRHAMEGRVARTTVPTIERPTGAPFKPLLLEWAFFMSVTNIPTLGQMKA